jgi:tape measure domain-containing protein
MANSFKDLLLRIGIDTRGLDAEVNKLQRKLTRFANQTERLGKTLTTNITLPLGLAGAAAVKTFADFDRLEKGLDVFASTGTTGAEELEKLLDVVRDARTTLDLKSAAGGALQLQAVGIEADRAREIIRQLGIAATVSGSEIADISEIVRQFAQALSLGRVLETDLRIIKQRIPAIGKILKDEFGTVTAEGLRSAGVSAEEFVDRLVGAIEKNQAFQNVQISAAKAIETFTTNVKIAVAEIGKIISKSLNLTDTLNSFAIQIDRVTQFLKSLDEGTRDFIVKLALFAAAIGPVLLALTGIIKTVIVVKETLGLLGGVLFDVGNAIIGPFRTAIIRMGEAILAGARNTELLGIALRSALPLAAVAAGVGLIIKAWKDYTYQLDLVNKTQDTLRSVEQESNQLSQERAVRVKSLIRILEDENATYDDKEHALLVLNTITNKQFKSVRVLKDEVTGLDDASKKYLSTLNAQIKLEKIQEKIALLQRQSLKILDGNLEDVNLSLIDYFKIITSGGFALSAVGSAQEYANRKFKNGREVVDANKKAIDALLIEFDELNKVLLENGKAVEENKNKVEGELEGTKDIFQELLKELEKIDYFGALFNEEDLAIAENKLSAIKSALDEAYDVENLEERTRLLGLITQIFADQQAEVDRLTIKLTDYQKVLKELSDIEFTANLTGENIIDTIKSQLDAIRSAQIDIPVESIDFLELEDKYAELEEKLKQEVESFIFNDLQKDLDSVEKQAANFGLSVEDLNNIKIDKLIGYLELVYEILGDNSAAADKVREALAKLGVTGNTAQQQLTGFQKFVEENAEQIAGFVKRGVENIFQIISEGFARRNEAKANLEEARKELLKLEATGKATKEELQAAEAAVLGFARTVATNDLFENIARAFKQIVVEIGKAILKALLFAAIVAALAEIFPALKAPLKGLGAVSDVAGAAGDGGGGLFAKLFKSFLFADGGLVYGPVSAIIGEGQGTNRRNPEVVAPLDKLKDYIDGNGAMMLTSRLSGSDLLLSVERAKRDRSR